MENFEKGPERILSPAEALEKIRIFSEGAEVLRDKSDEAGVYFIETKPEKRGNDTIAYEYLRTRIGVLNPDATARTEISRIFFDGEMVIYAEQVAFYDEKTGMWQDLE